MKLRETKVEEAVYEIQKIHETIFNLVAVEDEALLMRFGIQVQADSSSDDSEEEEIISEDSDRLFWSPDSVQEYSPGTTDELSQHLPNSADLKLLLEESRYNWFEIYDQFHDLLPQTALSDTQAIFYDLLNLDLGAQEVKLLKQSYSAFLAAEGDTCTYDQDRSARALSGQIVSESESDDPDSYIGVTDALSEAGKALVVKKRTAIRRRAKR